MADFTIVVMGFDSRNLCCVLEPAYVLEARNQAEAGWLAAESC